MRTSSGVTLVAILARGRTLDAVRENGLVYDDGKGPRALKLEASDDPAALGPADYVLITLKGQALPALGPSLAPLMAPQTAIVSAMNGVPWWFLHGFGGRIEGMTLESVDPGGRLKALFPVERVIGCVVHASAAAVAPVAIVSQGAPLGHAGSDGRVTDELRRRGRPVEMVPLLG